MERMKNAVLTGCTEQTEAGVRWAGSTALNEAQLGTDWPPIPVCQDSQSCWEVLWQQAEAHLVSAGVASFDPLGLWHSQCSKRKYLLKLVKNMWLKQNFLSISPSKLLFFIKIISECSVSNLVTPKHWFVLFTTLYAFPQFFTTCLEF